MKEDINSNMNILTKENHGKVEGTNYDKYLDPPDSPDQSIFTSVPQKFSVYKGFDLLFHSIEGYISNHTDPVSDMYAIIAIEHIGRNLAAAVKNESNLEARKKVAYGKILSDVAMCLRLTTSLHYLAHAMSAFHQELPHGAALIMLSKAYFTHMIREHVCDERFVEMAKALGLEDASEPIDFITMLVKLQEDCGIKDIKMSDYGIKPEEAETLAKYIKEEMIGLFMSDRCGFTMGDYVKIYKESYK